MQSSVDLSNRKVMRDAEPADQIEFKRGIYSHWALYVGDGEVIHLAGDDALQLSSKASSTLCCGVSSTKIAKATVRRDRFMDVAGKSKAVINNSKDKRFSPKSTADILRYAREQIGKKGYNLFFSNCEHFASYCRYRIATSDQVEEASKFVFVTGLIAMVLGVVFAIFRGRRN